MVRFSLLRLALFGAALVVLRLAGMGGWLLVVVAAVVAAALSYVLFGRQRTAAATWIAERRTGQRPRFGAGVAADEAAEDAAADAATRPPGDAPPHPPQDTPADAGTDSPGDAGTDTPADAGTDRAPRPTT